MIILINKIIKILIIDLFKKYQVLLGLIQKKNAINKKKKEKLIKKREKKKKIDFLSNKI